MFQLKKSVAALGLGAAMFAGMVTSAQALIIEGRFNMTVGDVSISLGEIDWSPPQNPGLDLVKTYGAFEVQTSVSSRSGVFSDAAFNAPATAGQIQDMSQNPGDANNIPIGPFAAKTDFFTLSAKPTWQFNIDNLAEGNLAGTPFSLTQINNIVFVSIAASGYACDNGAATICDPLTDPETSRWIGGWSTQYTGTSIQALINTILGGGTLPLNTWSATVEAVRISEPGSLALVGLALAGIGGIARRRAKAAK